MTWPVTKLIQVKNLLAVDIDSILSKVMWCQIEVLFKYQHLKPDKFNRILVKQTDKFYKKSQNAQQPRSINNLRPKMASYSLVGHKQYQITEWLQVQMSNT